MNAKEAWQAFVEGFKEGIALAVKILKKPFSALAYPFFPLVPECAYCAAMRYALIAALVVGTVLGFFVNALFTCLTLATAVGILIVLAIYAEYKFTHDNEQSDGK